MPRKMPRIPSIMNRLKNHLKKSTLTSRYRSSIMKSATLSCRIRTVNSRNSSSYKTNWNIAALKIKKIYSSLFFLIFALSFTRSHAKTIKSWNLSMIMWTEPKTRPIKRKGWRQISTLSKSISKDSQPFCSVWLSLYRNKQKLSSKLE